jgi:putative lipoic acid-binding regulatory protein
MAHAAGLLQGLAIGLVFKHEVLAQVGELFEALAKHERVRMVV